MRKKTVFLRQTWERTKHRLTREESGELRRLRNTIKIVFMTMRVPIRSAQARALPLLEAETPMNSASTTQAKNTT
jgi:CRISPR/Cas system-associated protein Cas7 (RAMP superfamily)